MRQLNFAAILLAAGGVGGAAVDRLIRRLKKTPAKSQKANGGTAHGSAAS